MSLFYSTELSLSFSDAFVPTCHKFKNFSPALLFATISERQFPLSHHCGIGDLLSVSSIDQKQMNCCNMW